MINITDVRITKVNAGKTLAYANINVDGLVIPGFKVMNGSNGLWVANPSYKDHNGEYQSTAYALDKETRTYIQETILNKYNGETSQTSSDDDRPF